MSSKAARHSKRNREQAGGEVASPSCIRVVKQKVDGADEAADLDLLSNVASTSEKTVRTKSLGVSDEGGSIYEEIRREDFAGEATTSEKISPTKEGSEKAYTSFPDRLMELLESEEDAVKKAIWWLPSGDSFAISPTHFNGKILSRFFRGIRFAQLLQKLSRWGFRRIRNGKVPGAHVYSHNLFRRGQPVLFKKYEAAKLKPSRPGDAPLVAEQDPSAVLDLGAEETKTEVAALTTNQDENPAPVARQSPLETKDDETPKEKESATKMIKDAELSMSYPERLMDLIDSDEEAVKKAIWWLPDGDTFAISPNHFSEQILSKYFQGSQFGSFIRKLNRWGFKKTLDDKLPFICYYHEFFKRGMRHLCRQIHSGKKGKQQVPAMVVSCPRQEPQAPAEPQVAPQLQQLLASVSAPQAPSNNLAASLLGSLLTPESMLLSQMASLAQQQQQQQQLQQQQQQQQQSAAINALVQQRLADMLALSQLDAARSQLQVGGGNLQSLLNAGSNNGGLQALLNSSNASNQLQALLSLQNDPLALALAAQQDQQQRALLQSTQTGTGGLSDLQRQILLAQAMQANHNGLGNFGNQR